jgi:integrase
MTIQFHLPKTGDAQNIHLTITKNVPSKDSGTQKFLFRIPLAISHKEWDEKKQRPSNIYLKRDKRIDAKLNEIKIRISEYMKEMEKANKTPSQRTISLKIKNICAEKTILYPESSLLYFVQLYIDSKKEIISSSTYKRYKVFFHLIEKFEGSIMERLYIDTIDGRFIKKFIFFGKEEAYSENTIYRSIHFIRTILNFAERKGIRTSVQELEIRREKQQRDIVTLNEQEILEIKKADLPKELQSARDWLLISCYTGQRISDFMEFSIEKLVEVNGETCISFIQKKTKKKMLLPLHPVVLNVIKKNGNRFPQKIALPAYNEHIKKIALLVGLTEPVRVKKRNGYRAENILLEKWEALSSHIGRRSFATMFYGKIPTPLLMEATGHTTEQMFLRYINPIDPERILSLSKYFNKTYFMDDAL